MHAHRPVNDAAAEKMAQEVLAKAPWWVKLALGGVALGYLLGHADATRPVLRVRRKSKPPPSKVSPDAEPAEAPDIDVEPPQVDAAGV